MRPSRTTTLATALVAVAALLPTGAWYLAGNRNLDRQAEELAEAARASVAREVGQAARDLAERLEAVRRTETARPFYHYQSLYHDPDGAAQGLAVTPSPLAGGASDALVLSHFQIDPQGRVSLPAVNERFPELSAREGLAAYCDFLTAMHDVVVLEPEAPALPDEERVLALDRLAWEQNVLAESVYAMLTGKPAAAADLPAEHAGEQVVIRVGAMGWRTLMVGSGLLLAAVREVATPAGTMLQGFAVAPADALRAVVGEAPGWSLAPASRSVASPTSHPVGDTGWWLDADVSPALAAAATESSDLRRRFHGRFSLGLLAVLVTAGAVVALVAGSERLALQRAAFAAAAAHELKTPIASLRLHGEMLAESLGDPASSARHARRIAEDSARLGRLVTNMLDLARLERGATLVRAVPGDLGAAACAAARRFAPAFEAAGLELELAVDPELPRGRFDPDAVAQVLDNLLDNAEKHTRGGARSRVRVEVGRRRDQLEVAVIDDGPGIPRADRKHLFRPFSRRPGAPSGLGLGLALGRSLARAQGGDLVLEEGASETRFVLTLPLAPP